MKGGSCLKNIFFFNSVPIWSLVSQPPFSSHAQIPGHGFLKLLSFLPRDCEAKFPSSAHRSSCWNPSLLDLASVEKEIDLRDEWGRREEGRLRWENGSHAEACFPFIRKWKLRQLYGGKIIFFQFPNVFQVYLFHLNYSGYFLNGPISFVSVDLCYSYCWIYKILGMGSVCSHAGLVQSQGLLAQVLALSYTPGAFAGTGPSPPIEGKFQKLMSSVVFVNCILNSSLTQHRYHNCFTLLACWLGV